MERQNKYIVMASDEDFERDIASAADVFDMHIMQCFGGAISDFKTQLENYKGELAESMKAENPELADEISNYQFKPRDIISIFNDYISLSFDELKEMTEQQIESTEIVNNEFGE